MQFSFEMAGQRVDRMTNFVRHADELHLIRLHLEGEARNNVGQAALWQVAHELGRYFGVKILRVEGGRRTTGSYKG